MAGIAKGLLAKNVLLRTTMLQSPILATLLVAGGGGGPTLPTNLVAPSISGDPVVGQVLHGDDGSWSGSPTSYTRQWYEDSGGGFTAIAGATGDTYLVQDIDANLNKQFKFGVIASNGAGSASEVRSTATAIATQINLANAITSFTRTSASGTTPMVWNITFASNVYAGYMTRWQVFSSSTMLSTERLQDVYYQLTDDDLVSGANLQAGLAAAGLTAPGATEWLHCTVFTTSPNGVGFNYADVVPISPTDAVVPMVWSTTDHKSGMVLSNGNLTIAANGTWSVARVNRGIGAGKKVYVEMTGDDYPGVATLAASLVDAHGGVGGDGTATAEASEYQVFAKKIWFNGTNVAAPNSWTSAADVKGIALDTTGANPVVSFYLNGVFQNTRTLTGISLPLYFMTTMPNGKSTTLNPGTTPGGTTGFTYTPPAGFVAP